MGMSGIVTMGMLRDEMMLLPGGVYRVYMDRHPGEIRKLVHQLVTNTPCNVMPPFNVSILTYGHIDLRMQPVS